MLLEDTALDHPQASPEISDLEAAIVAAGVTTGSVTVYRAVVGDAAFIGKVAGDGWISPAYLSTSTCWNNLHTHSRNLKGEIQRAIVLTIRIPPCFNLAYIHTSVTAGNHESEVLLGRDHHFKIRSRGEGLLSQYTPHAPRIAELEEISIALIP